MIDAQLYNQRTGQMWTLRDFCYGDKYIADQNGTRLHPACRSNDPIGSWQFACFDLSAIWESDPSNWVVTKIWIAFDNGNDGATGQARTYFDLLYISYGVRNVQSHTQNGDNALVSGSIVWHYTLRPDGYYDLWLKVTCLGFDNGTWPYGLGTVSITPQMLKISSISYDDAQTPDNPKPTGVNLEQGNSSEPPSAVQKLAYDGMFAIGDSATGGLMTIVQLASDVWGLFNAPPPEPRYEWPYVNSSFIGNIHPETALGEVMVLVPGLASGMTSIEMALSVDFECWTWGPYYPMRVILNTVSMPITIAWNTSLDPQSDSPNDPDRPSGRICGYVGMEYSYSTRTYDPNGDDVRYFFDWNDGSTGITGLYASGVNASLSHGWNTFGSYSIKVQALDQYGLWSAWSSTLDVAVYGMGDTNHDGFFDIFDIVLVGGLWYNRACPPAPIDADAVPDNYIDIFDLTSVAVHFGESYSYPPGFGTSLGSRESQLLDGQAASVFLSPNPITVSKHQAFTVNVTLTDAVDVYGWQFELYWNNTVLSLTSAQVTPPQCWGEDTFELGAGIQNDFNETSGRYWKAMSALNPAPSFNGSMTLVTLTFEALNTGSTGLTLQNVGLSDSQALSIDHTDTDGLVTVTQLPLYMRSDQHAINNATMYKLTETHTQNGTSTSMYTGDPENDVAGY